MLKVEIISATRCLEFKHILKHHLFSTLIPINILHDVTIAIQ